MSTSPVKVAVTGAAGQIGYSLLFRIASGALLGAGHARRAAAAGDHPGAQGARGRGHGARRLRVPDCWPASRSATTPTPSSTASTSPCWSARVRATKGMERGDLLEANGAIFTVQGKALNETPPTTSRIGVTGNPANTNALIAMSNAPDIPRERFTALTRLDHNRAMAQLAAKTGATVTDIKKMTIWGNHSATQYPDIFHAEVGGKNAAEVVDDQAWLENDFIPTVQKRGAAIIEARGSSSAASAAIADHRPRPRLAARHAPTATGCRWRSSPTARTASPRA